MCVSFLFLILLLFFEQNVDNALRSKIFCFQVVVNCCCCCFYFMVKVNTVSCCCIKGSCVEILNVFQLIVK